MELHKLDRIDIKILNILQENGATTNRELSQRIALSPGPTLTRVKRLRETGFIRSQHARINLAGFGFDHYRSLFVKLLPGEDHQNRFRRHMQETPMVLSVFCLAQTYQIGGSKYQLKVLARNDAHFRQWLGTTLLEMPYLADLEIGPPMEVLKDCLELPVNYDMIDR